MKRIILLFIFCYTITYIHGQLTGTFTDNRDGKIYKVVNIGNQWWMAENLAYLPSINSLTEHSWSIPRYYIYGYEGTDLIEAKNTYNYKTYGVLYNWPAALEVCPNYWHLPSDAEFKELEINLGMSQADANKTNFRGTDEGGKLKETGTIHWYKPNTGATNSTGFTALPAGINSEFGKEGLRQFTYFWSNTEGDFSAALDRRLFYDDSRSFRGGYFKIIGVPVRCLKDQDQFTLLRITDSHFYPVSCLNFTYGQTIDTIIVTNSGAVDTINISSIHTIGSEFNLGKSTSVLLPEDSIHLMVKFNPTGFGHFYDSICYKFDDSNKSVIYLPLLEKSLLMYRIGRNILTTYFNG